MWLDHTPHSAVREVVAQVRRTQFSAIQNELLGNVVMNCCSLAYDLIRRHRKLVYTSGLVRPLTLVGSDPAGCVDEFPRWSILPCKLVCKISSCEVKPPYERILTKCLNRENELEVTTLSHKTMKSLPLSWFDQYSPSVLL